MHTSFDLYPSYFRRFPNSVDCNQSLRLRYNIHAMRNYAFYNEGAKRTGPFPQVRHEGSLEIKCKTTPTRSKYMDVHHSREWSTWTGQAPSSKQDIIAKVHYADDATGTLKNWEMSYSSTPILPVKSYKYNELGPMLKHGRIKQGMIELTASREGVSNIQLNTMHPVTTLYTLIERFQSDNAVATTVDYLDDLTMLRPGLAITTLPDDTIEIEGVPTKLHGYALVGPAILPLFIWMDERSNVIAVIGRNVAYTLIEAENV
tara:strand:- start:8 stop:787 length:780 start_codon:yes stop_codon:yes gene_type:complete